MDHRGDTEWLEFSKHDLLLLFRKAERELRLENLIRRILFLLEPSSSHS